MIYKNSILMNITQTFRRKNKYHKPIIVFKELYRDYFQHASPRKQSQQNSAFARSYKNKEDPNNESQVMLKVKKTNSSQQLSKYLQKYGDPGTSVLKFTYDEQPTLRRTRSTQNSTYVFRLLERNQLQDLQKEKRSYFGNSYTKSHALFEKGPQFFKEKMLDDRQNQMPKILPQIFKESDKNLRKPLQKRIQLEELKSKFNERKQLAVQKFSKIRYNFLIKQNYKPHVEGSICSVKKQIQQKNSFQVTKQNIFPQPFN